MELVSIEQMQNADRYTIEVLKVPGRTLMHRAASAIAAEIIPMAAAKEKFSVAVFTGPGNNGGDGWAAACILAENKIETTVYSGCSPETLGGDALFYAQKAIDRGIEIAEAIVPEELSSYDVVLDAIFGIGLKRRIDGIYKEYILAINNQAKYIISADIPSGLHSDEGVPFDYAVKADKTVTFGRAKASIVSQPGCTYAGHIILHDIGIPDEAYRKDGIRYLAVDTAYARKVIRPREKISSKGTYGRVLLVTGSPGMTGATALCAEACLRSGSGLVYCAVPKSRVFEYDSLVKEAISVPVEDGGKQYVSSDGTGDIKKAAANKNAVVIGPGMSQDSDSHVIFDALTGDCSYMLIADAQVLNDISENMDVLMEAGENTILTPHPGEMSRLTGVSITRIQENRIKTAVGFANKHGVIVLLKGHRTVVTDGVRVFINTTGNPGMATAGSGDVLTGIIASCGALTEDAAEAAAVAAFIHGAAGDRAARRFGEYSMKSGDIINEVPWVMKNLAGV